MWKGTAKPGLVPPARWNKQSGLNCTGCGSSTVGRATAGSMVRQRSVRWKPLSLVHQCLQMRDDVKTKRSELAGLYVLCWWMRLTHPAWGKPSNLMPCIVRGRARHLPIQRSKAGTRELVLSARNTEPGSPRRPERGKSGAELP